jgi:hypothetical protein
MIKLNENTTRTIIFCLIFSYGLYIYKPKLIFDENNNIKKFGLRREETIYPFWLVIIVASYTFYYMCLIRKGNYI